MNGKTVRNVIIFIIVALASGWIGLLIDSFLDPQPEGNTLGMGVWLVLPLLVTVLFRALAGDGWKDIGLRLNLKGNLLSTTTNKPVARMNFLSGKLH